MFEQNGRRSSAHAYQVLDPTPVLSGFRGTDRTRFAETRDRVLLPGRQLSRIQTLLAAPAAPRRASSIPAVVINACSRAAAVQR